MAHSLVIEYLTYISPADHCGGMDAFKRRSPQRTDLHMITSLQFHKGTKWVQCKVSSRSCIYQRWPVTEPHTTQPTCMQSWSVFVKMLPDSGALQTLFCSVGGCKVGKNSILEPLQIHQSSITSNRVNPGETAALAILNSKRSSVVCCYLMTGGTRFRFSRLRESTE